MYVFSGKASSATITCGVTLSEPGRGAGPGIWRLLSSSALYGEEFLNTPPSEILPLHPTSTYRNLQSASTTARSTILNDPL